jgi:hypothetical protein
MAVLVIVGLVLVGLVLVGLELFYGLGPFSDRWWNEGKSKDRRNGL